MESLGVYDLVDPLPEVSVPPVTQSLERPIFPIQSSLRAEEGIARGMNVLFFHKCHSVDGHRQ